ncbi:MAG: hypothetical protein IPP66_18445 [Anaerolineales bacterium]|nr:hypothetical protein [Anaerolineales bacterium]
MEYTLLLALVDFLPIVFTAVGLFAITRIVAHVNSLQGKVAFYGTLLTLAGGIFKALWKLIMASSNSTVDIQWMEKSLFVLMAPGYVLVAWSVWQTMRAAQGKRSFHAWAPPLTLIGVVFTTSAYLFVKQPVSPAWERVLLSVMVLATLFTGVFLILFSFRQGLPSAGWLFILNLIGIFLLNGLARLDNQPITLQWIEEGINIIAWLAFAMASTHIYGYARANFKVDSKQIGLAATS